MQSKVRPHTVRFEGIAARLGAGVFAPTATAWGHWDAEAHCGTTAELASVTAVRPKSSKLHLVHRDEPCQGLRNLLREGQIATYFRPKAGRKGAEGCKALCGQEQAAGFDRGTSCGR